MLLYVSNYIQVNRSLIYSPQVSPRDNNTVTLSTIMYSTLAYQHSPFTVPKLLSMKMKQQCLRLNRLLKSNVLKKFIQLKPHTTKR
jgi:hypothetical protein